VASASWACVHKVSAANLSARSQCKAPCDKDAPGKRAKKSRAARACRPTAILVAPSAMRSISTHPASSRPGRERPTS
jgi:hypothetical protein